MIIEQKASIQAAGDRNKPLKTWQLLGLTQDPMRVGPNGENFYPMAGRLLRSAVVTLWQNIKREESGNSLNLQHLIPHPNVNANASVPGVRNSRRSR